ncbi:MAG: hypothetical protein EXS03_05310 [Phycisphaerales bacterium]|nr:hypothetical protein [Phycisphaerales bacterium]
MSADLEIAWEREGDRGWSFGLTLSAVDTVGAAAATASITAEITLAWADYDWWSPDGSATPASVARAVARVFARALESVDGSQLPAHFDASTVRRRVGGSDQLIADELGQHR